MEWITGNGPSLILKVVLFLVIIFVFRILSRVARKVVRKAINRSNLQVSVLLERTALSVTGSVVMIFGMLVALSQLGSRSHRCSPVSEWRDSLSGLPSRTPCRISLRA